MKEKILLLGPKCTSIEEFLTMKNFEIIQTENQINEKNLSVDNFIFCVSYGYRFILSKKLISKFNSNIINLHISYLPFNRGADPNFWSFIDNTPKGVSIHELEEGIDTGKIFIQEEIEFDSNIDTLASSYHKLKQQIETLFIKNFIDIKNKKLKATPQIGTGSFHLMKDKESYIHLIHEKIWDTPIKELINKNSLA